MGTSIFYNLTVTGRLTAGAFTLNDSLSVDSTLSVTGLSTFGGNVVPSATNTKTLGTSSLLWNNVYATTFTGTTFTGTTFTGTTFTGALTGNVTGNADTATTLATARTINGTSFDGSVNITTSSWGTARDLYIADSSSTNTGSAVSMSGSGNATLLLPATIKATLVGNVTGNVSGSSGSCTGNSATATTASACSGNSVTATTATTATKVSATGNTTTKAYVLGTTASGTTPLYDSNVYLDTTEGMVTATTFKGALLGNATTSSSCSGNSATATTASACSGLSAKATADADGNTITSKYVTLDTIQTISGAKTLSSVLTSSSYLIVNPGSLANYCEGLRVNKASSGLATIVLGGASGSTAGTGTGVWSIHNNTSNNFVISYNSSTDTSSGALTLHNDATAKYTGTLTVTNGVTATLTGSATKLSNTTAIGSTSKPVYFTANGVPEAISYTIGTSVPSGALFTDKNLLQTSSSANANYPILASDTVTSTTSRTSTSVYDSDIYLNPSSGAITATTFKGALTGNADTATKFNSVRTIKLSGNVTGAIASDGASGWSITTTIPSSTVTNAMLANSSVTIGTTAIALGGSSLTLAGLTSVTATTFATASGDIADCLDAPDCVIEYGRCYRMDAWGKVGVADGRCQQGTLGIHSDTAGQILGKKEGTSQVRIAVGGYVLAYVDDVYESGTALVSGKGGTLTKARWYERLFHPERIVGTFLRDESADVVYGGAVNVWGRKWVKVR